MPFEKIATGELHEATGEYKSILGIEPYNDNFSSDGCLFTNTGPKRFSLESLKCLEPCPNQLGCRRSQNPNLIDITPLTSKKSPS